MQRILVGLALATLTALPASAAPFTWVVTGQITSREALASELDPVHQFNPYLHVGDAFTWTLQMESSVPDRYPDLSSCGLYFPITSMTFTSGALSLSTVDPGQDFVVSTPDSRLCDVPPDYLRVRASFAGLTILMHILHGPPTDALPVAPPPAGAIVDFLA